MAVSPAMDFFEHQAVARRRTGLLVGYYALAVALIIVAVYAAVVVIFGLAEEAQSSAPSALTWWNPDLFVGVAVATLSIVLLGTAFKIAQLRAGGEAVARSLGGRPVSPLTDDPDERRLLNVVEEMAIASGTPVPRVFVLDEEPGINAFAAGCRPGDAVIGVTRGCMQRLTRDELQGVIAHEFSHILNGDMRLNLRLMGVLHGILLLALIGYGLVRSVGRPVGRARGRRREGGTGAIVLLGAALMAIGYIGVFFARLIKSAVSRQREFLADASSVQFTRNPAGLAGALRKIMDVVQGSRVITPKAEEASHLFFANALASRWFQLWATHPPIEERIRRIDPAYLSGAPAQAAAAASRPAAWPPEGAAGAAAWPAMSAEAVAEQVGRPRPEHLKYVSRLMGSLPAEVLAATHDRTGAWSLLYALLLSADSRVRDRQLASLAGSAPPEVRDELGRLMPRLAGLPPETRLPLAELCVETLREMPDAIRRALWSDADRLMRADQAIDLFEYALARLIRRRLLGETAARGRDGRRDAPGLWRTAAVDLLSCLAWWGADEETAARSAFAGGLKLLGWPASTTMRPAHECGLPLVDQSLDVLSRSPLEWRRRLIQACAACVGFDQRVTTEEAELLRAVADSLDCPLPPLPAVSAL